MDFAGGAGGVAGNPAAGVDFMSWYKEIPPISRLYLTGAFLSTAACAAEMVSPYQLYFNYDLVLKGQFWRLITSYLYFGAFSVDFLFHMYFLARYSRLLEESDFRGRTANYILFLLFGIVGISIMASYLNVNFLGQSLTFMMAYVWGRRNPNIRMSMFGVLTFNAPYLPYVMLGFAFLIGNSPTMDIVGIVTGHCYYFLEYVYPVVAEVRGWKVKRLLEPPAICHWICGDQNYGNVHLHEQ